MTRKKNKGANVSQKIRQRIYNRDGWRCWLCGNPVEPAQASLDHVIPRTKGGTNKQSNLRLAHKRCNGKRGSV